jgi:putative oxygen-independent coproporphyrinogen III oxidase
MKSEDSPGLYIHVPFCKTKCPYCDFYSVTASPMIPEWLDAVSREIGLYQGRFSPFDTLYIGGGTPSFLGAQEIAALMRDLRAGFEITDDAEITIEANPDDITPEKCASYREVGINRVSLGVQSFRDEELRFLGRRHDARSAQRAIGEIRDAEFTNLGIDLIYGFDGQTPAGWKETLERALSYSPEHLSCYQMTIEPETEFGRLRAEGRIREMAEEDQRTLFVATAETCARHGYLHYEISNFARREEHVSRHNHKYWHHAPYLGLGPSAHSFENGTRWWNVRSAADYCGLLKEGATPVEDSESLTDEQLSLEEIYLGFRTKDGVSLELLHRYPGWERALAKLEDESLLRIVGDRAVLTLEGFLVADGIPFLIARP